MERRTFTTTAVVVPLMVAALGAAPGCGAGGPGPSSPEVAADSEAGKAARAEDERLRLERKAEEAKASRRVRGLPAEG